MAEVRQRMEELNINKSNLAFEIIIPKSRGTPFLKLTFLTAGERRDATGLLNSIKQETGYIISRSNPGNVRAGSPSTRLE